MELLTITYKYRIRDLFLPALKQHLGNLISKRMIAIYITFLLLSAGFLYAINALSVEFFLYTLQRGVLYLLLLKGLILLRVYGDSKRKIETDPLYSKECTRTIDKEGMTTFFGTAEEKEEWSNFYSYKVSSSAYIIYVTKLAEIRLPISAFKTEQEMIFAEQCIKQIDNTRGER